MWTLLALGAAMAAAGLLVPHPGGVARLRVRSPRRWPAWVRGRPGALRVRTRAVAASGVAAVVALGVGIGLAGCALGAAAGIGTFVGLSFLDPGREQARRHALSLELPDALDLIAACLAAGAPIGTACREVARVAPPVVADELRLVLARTAIGVSDSDAWRQSCERAVIGPVARDVARATSSGTALTACLRRHASEGRRERQAVLEARAKAVGISSVLPMSLCFLPAFVLVGIVPIIAGIALALLR